MVIFHSNRRRGQRYYKQLAPKSCYVQSAWVKVLAVGIRGSIVVGRREFSCFSANLSNTLLNKLNQMIHRFLLHRSSINVSLSGYTLNSERITIHMCLSAKKR